MSALSQAGREFELEFEIAIQLATRDSTLATPVKQGRRESNSQPPVLETGALPIELHP